MEANNTMNQEVNARRLALSTRQLHNVGFNLEQLEMGLRHIINNASDCGLDRISSEVEKLMPRLHRAQMIVSDPCGVLCPVSVDGECLADVLEKYERIMRDLDDDVRRMTCGDVPCRRERCRCSSKDQPPFVNIGNVTVVIPSGSSATEAVDLLCRAMRGEINR